MANGLLGNLLRQSSNADSGLFGGPSIFSSPPTRGERRSRLLTDLISGAGSDPYARLGAAFGGLIGMGGRAAAEGLGIVDEPKEVSRNRAIREVQQLTSKRGLDPLDPGFGEFVAEEFQKRGFGDLAINSLGLSRQLQSQLAPDPVETEIRFVGGTPRAKALQERYPEVGQVEDGQEITIKLLDGDFRGVSAGDAPEEETAPSRIREYELALEKGLIDENTSLPEYNQMRAGGGRSSVTPTETQLSPYAAVINSNEDLNERIKSLVENADPATLGDFNIPFTGGRDQDAVDAVSLQAQQRAAEIRSDNAELTIEQALEQAIDELSQGRGEPTPDENASGGQAGTATPQNDAFAGRVNP